MATVNVAPLPQPPAYLSSKTVTFTGASGLGQSGTNTVWFTAAGGLIVIEHIAGRVTTSLTGAAATGATLV